MYLLRYDPKIEIPASRAVASRPLNPNQDGPDVQFVFTYATRGVSSHNIPKILLITPDFVDHLMAAEIIPNPNTPSLPKLAKLAHAKNPIVLEEEDDGGEPTPEPEVVAGTAPRTGAGRNASTLVAPPFPSKRPRNVRRDFSALHKHLANPRFGRTSVRARTQLTSTTNPRRAYC